MTESAPEDALHEFRYEIRTERPSGWIAGTDNRCTLYEEQVRRGDGGDRVRR